MFIFSFRVDTKPRGKPERKLDNDEERDRPGCSSDNDEDEEDEVTR